MAGCKLRVNGGALTDSIIDVGDVTSYLITGVDGGTDYDVEVERYDDVGTESGYSTPVTQTTMDAPSMANPYNLVIEGDSRAVTAAWPDMLQTELGTSYTIQSVATAGHTMRQIITDGQYASQAAPLVDGSAVANFLLLEAGINDLGGSYSRPQMQTDYQDYCEDAQADGYVVVACTIFAADPYVVGGNEANRVAFNDWLRLNYTTFADRLCDFDAEPSLQDPSDLTYFTDGTHLTTAGQQVCVDLVREVLAI